MTNENRELLEEVIAENLTKSKHADNEDEAKIYFNRAMAAVDKVIDQDKVDCGYTESMNKSDIEKDRLAKVEIKKLEIEEQKLEIERLKIENSMMDAEEERKFRASESKKNMLIKVGEIVGVVAISRFIDYAFNCKLSKKIMSWEEGNTFTTTPGRALRDVLRFKK